jgi:hypothetical protein
MEVWWEQLQKLQNEISSNSMYTLHTYQQIIYSCVWQGVQMLLAVSTTAQNTKQKS